jgi:15-cis-phytoene synthase
MSDYPMPSTPKHFTDSRTTNFYYSFLFLPPEKRRAIESVYYFARRSDDAADDPQDTQTAMRRLTRCHAVLDACYADGGGAFENAAFQELARSIRRFRIPRQPFEDLLLGVEMDLGMDHGRSAYQSFQDLEVYCYRVASTIGLIAIEIFGYRNEKTHDYAVRLGKALQMVNILRDVQSDARRGRIYMPVEDLERFGIDPTRLAAGCYSDNFVRLMSFECDRAIAYFQQAHQFLAPEDRRSMRPAEIMGAIYWRLMREIQRRSYNVFGPAIRLSRPTKFATALKVYLGAEWQK